MNEKFIYLADQANMPYGNYFSEGKSDLLIEHIIKDTQFLLSNKYYTDSSNGSYKTDKETVKLIVVACNTATAYGKEHIEKFIEKTGSDIKVIGVIDAGARGALAQLEKKESGSIGVLATVGTIASNGYEKALRKLKDAEGFTGEIMIFNQGGYGIAEAVDGETDFIEHGATEPRQNYRGPTWNDPHYTIDKALWDVYRFDERNLLCDSKNVDECRIIQLNSPENYVRYHLVSLLEKIRRTPNAPPLKVLLLGCTHYPYLTKEIHVILSELYNFKMLGKYVYREVMAKEIKLVDPAVNVAREVYDYLDDRNLFNETSNVDESEFYISVPNHQNPNVVVDEKGWFTYDYKFGRKEGEIQEYVRVVPFSKQNISDETLERLAKQIPVTYDLVVEFNNRSNKTFFLRDTLVNKQPFYVIR